MTTRVESPVPGVVLLHLSFEGNASLTPLHWRVGDWTKPPLDIEINPDNGVIQAVQVVLEDEQIVTTETRSMPGVEVGIPAVTVTDWPKDRYRDVTFSPAFVRTASDELVVRVAEGVPVALVGVPGSVLFGWDADRQLCQLVVGPLSAREWDMIDSVIIEGPPPAR